MHVLVVQPDRSAAAFLIQGLGRHGYEARSVDTGREALKAHQDADLVLLDLELPDVDGLEVCRSIRATGDTPIITLTSGRTELDKVLCFQAGSDDCLAKPYGFRELLARMQAVLRRVRRPAVSRQEWTVLSGSLQIDPRARQVWIADQAVELTRKEFDLLHLLASQPGAVFSRRELMSQVWQEDWMTSGRTIDTHVSTLRGKLGDVNWIVTVRGIGYRFAHAYEVSR